MQVATYGSVHGMITECLACATDGIALKSMPSTCVPGFEYAPRTVIGF